MRRALMATTGLLVLALSACTGTDAADPPASSSAATTTSPSTTTPTTASPITASPTGPTPPVMPEAAKTHDEAGAKAFVKYFWDVVNYAQATGDTDAIKALSVQGCGGCESGIAAIRKVYDKGGRIVGGAGRVSGLKARWRNSANLTVAEVRFKLLLEPQQVDYPDDSQDWSSDGGSGRRQMDLLADDSGWKAAQFHEAT